MYVASSKNTIDGQEYVYARDDNQKGTYSLQIMRIDGTKTTIRYISTITKDATKSYKTGLCITRWRW